MVAEGIITRPTLWRIGHIGEVAFYYLVILASFVFAYGAYKNVKRYTTGQEDWFDRIDDLPKRIVTAAGIVFSNRKLFDRDTAGGLMHTFIMWGFLTLLIGTTILAIDLDIYRKITGLLGNKQSFFVGDFYLAFSLVMDAMGLLFVVGIGVALYRRYAARKWRLWGRHTSVEDDLFIWALFLLGVGGYVTEGLRILGTGFPEFETVSFVGWFIADVLVVAGVTESMAQAVYPVAWWSHSLLALGFIAAIPFGKPFHMLSSYANIVARDEKAGKRLPGVPADLDADTGAEDIEDFTWKEMLDQDACTKCGRCSSVCPANASGRPLDPRNVILDLKKYRNQLDAGETEEMDIIADGGESVIDAETMESCMACMACMDACPVDIEHLKSFTRMNRQLTDQGDVRSNVQDTFGNIMGMGNTFGNPQDERADWADELEFDITDAREEDVEYLWYVGDYPSFDERNKKVARSLAKILEHADVEYGILFEDEKYDGNDIRRLGEEFLYIDLAGHHVETFDEVDPDKIICTDPHSYNTFKNEYPEMEYEEFADDPMMDFEFDEEWNADGDIDVLHWTQAVEEMVTEGRLGLRGNELDTTVTYHDPCHLGRYNDEYEAPRELIRATGATLSEMPRNRNNSFCCGGGGGGLWMDIDEESKPSEERMREALEDTDAGSAVEKFVVACPMCMTMYEDGRKTGGYEDDIEVVDVAELVVDAIESKPGVDSAATSQATGQAD
ncbi:heterodisulfide reductase-related iron-sulfur binding cluster [Haloarculaceae archaeon H-GB2-1]|nr:heterodisulfide reductase-related iron-sulfur binding cluster [Haloarculaceae archaeon H-GB1-1]MEA5386722.1 heterodisulfide reductase-related iron-sulfur binding cluster [Haloarculaceae archaeon H-GB11]MEA5408248.1 heterodisulfide reductase-related iron-sulfur binding cluster [Haloarculaceae archaeon H-GB2-1]